MFQIVDDILDVIGDERRWASPSGSDERHGKRTYVSVFGLDRARELAAESHAKARAALAGADGGTETLERIARLHPHPPELMSPNKTHDEPPLLPGSTAPADLKGLSDAELQRLAQEVREQIIDTIGEIGGHFGANLGACEIAVAIHSLLDSPARQGPLGRRPPGLPAQDPHRPARRARHDPQVRAGSPRSARSSESEHDIMGAGHASTSISYAVGLKEAMRRGVGEDGRVVAVIGDGALTGGVAFEALHNAGGLEAPIVIVLNDNGMSIAPNVGALSRYFNRIRLNPAASTRARTLEERPDQAARRHRGAVRAPRADLQGVAQGLLGARPLLRGARPRLRRRDRRPRRRRAARGDRRGARGRPAGGRARETVKGKGFAPAEDGGLEGMEKWHAAKPASIVERRRRRRRRLRSRARARPRRRSTRRSSARPSSGGARATSGSSASRPR